jgi:four helix bundle protein
MAVKHHTDLVCYQQAARLRAAVYAEIARPAWKSDWKLRDDLRRSARSVSANIAEGYWRYHHRDFVRFIDIALGSLGETEEPLESARLAGLLDDDTRATLVDIVVRTRVPMLRLRNYLVSTSAPEAPAADGRSRRSNTKGGPGN